MTKWLHTFGSIGAIALAFLSPSVSTLIAAHPAVSLGLGSLYAILGHLLPSPLGGSGDPTKGPIGQ